MIKSRIFVIFYFLFRKKSPRNITDICDVYGSDAIKESTSQSWFKKFRSEKFTIKHGLRSARLNGVDEDEIKSVIDSDRHVSV